MDISTAISIMHQALWVAIIVPAPLLAAGLAVGLIVGTLQAVTQIHEMTLVFIPKMIVSGLVLYVLGHWMLATLVNFAHRLFSSIPGLVS
jgi:flagellar biosynthetic protein FliQ